jgi:hypothetical protein
MARAAVVPCALESLHGLDWPAALLLLLLLLLLYHTVPVTVHTEEHDLSQQLPAVVDRLVRKMHLFWAILY